MFSNPWRLWLRLVSCLYCLRYMQLQALPSRADFVSLDCGKPDGFGQNDETTDIFYSSDAGHISTGEIRNVSSEYYNLHGEQARDLRSFPKGARNCYSIAVNQSYGKFLVRAWFLYGNYDGKRSPPKFDLHLGTNLWRSVDTVNDSNWQFHEAITLLDAGRNISVCLVNSNTGVPFISALEVRPLDEGIYKNVDVTRFLLLLARLDVNGDYSSIGQPKRYSSDPFDRIWEGTARQTWNLSSTKEHIEDDGSGYYVPQDVLKTAMYPKQKEQLSFCWGEVKENKSKQFFAYIYIVEMRPPPPNGTRQVEVRFGSTLNKTVNLTHNKLTTVTWTEPNVRTNPLEIEFVRVGFEDGRIVSALEVYSVMGMTETETNKTDVDAINGIKIALNVERDDWAGDPCSPQNYTWSGLNCRYTTFNPKIIKLYLSSSGLTGEIPEFFRNLDGLEDLDLSNNKLKGRIPDFLCDLPLKTLNISSNRFKGTIPKCLREKQLNFSYGNNPSLCETADWRSCKRNSIKLAVAIISALAAVLLIGLLILLIIRKQKLRKQVHQRIRYGIDGATIGSSHCMMDFHSESKQFTFTELRKITNNFSKVIGKGGFGFVFYGVLDDGMEVAVKQLSHSSLQGPREFIKEAQLLSRIHHKHLVSLVGYCDDVQNLALVYEYMSKGSLKDHLSGKSSDAQLLTWRERLRIGTEICQGLEYLHKGCKPSIIHRDVKTSNILLNHNMEAKVADFGLSKIVHNDSRIDHHSHVSTSVMGTPGYLDPEYSSTNQLTEKSDVYSFGIVLLELLTGLEAIIKQEYHVHIVQLVEPILQKGDISEVMDKKLQGEYEINSAWKAIEIALSCTHNESKERPTTTEVIMQLKDCIEMEDHGKISSSNLGTSISSGLDIPPPLDTLIGYPRAR